MHKQDTSVAVFLDWENLYYSGQNNQIIIDPEEIVEIAQSYGRITELRAYGDFDNPTLAASRGRLEAVSADIQHVPIVNGKSYTDFQMLDNIYQAVIDNSNLTHLILGTGDGHFAGVVSRLRTRLNKHVTVVAAQGSLSRRLETSASAHHLLTTGAENAEELRRELFEFVARGINSGKKVSFTSTLRTFRPRLEESQVLVRPTLQWLLDNQYLRRDEHMYEGNPVALLAIGRLYEPEQQ